MSILEYFHGFRLKGTNKTTEISVRIIDVRWRFKPGQTSERFNAQITCFLNSV